MRPPRDNCYAAQRQSDDTSPRVGHPDLPMSGRCRMDAMSDGWEARAAEGEAIAPRSGTPEVDARLLALLLDPEDTAVTYRTALALLRQRTPEAVRVVVCADARADANHSDWIGDAFATVRADALGDDDEFLRSTLSGLSADRDEACARAARALATWMNLT